MARHGEPFDRLDPTELFGGLSAVADMVNAGDHGLPAIRRLVELAHAATGGLGAAFVEYGASGGRVIAVSGVMDWALGLKIDTASPAVASLIAQGRLHEYSPVELRGEPAAQMIDRGIGRVVRAWAQLRGQVVGSLHVYHAAPDHFPNPTDRAVLVFLAGFIGNLYRDNPTLPVSPHVPAQLASSDAVAVVSDGVVQAWNDAAVKITGISAAEAVGTAPPFPVAHPGQVLEHRLPNGRCVQLLSSPLPSGEFLLVLRDLTDAHRREQSRDLFVAVTGHELRTPVTVIKGYADTLVDRWDQLTDASRRDAARVLGQRARELAGLVDRLLNAAAPDGESAAPPATTSFDLVDALRTTVGQLGPAVQPRVSLHLPELPLARGEEPTVASVLSELITNAVKYSPKDSEVDLFGIVDGRTVGFQVADRGIGIKPEHVERAFERFWQAETGDQRRYGGVGLGLYLVRKLIERQGGWVSIHPRERGGTVVEVRLPRADVTGAVPAA